MHACWQVLKGRLALLEPTITCGDFMYEEGADLEADAAEESRVLLPRAMATLPGGGLAHGCIAEVQDNAQSLVVQIIISHHVGSVPAACSQQTGHHQLDVPAHCCCHNNC